MDHQLLDKRKPDPKRRAAVIPISCRYQPSARNIYRPGAQCFVGPNREGRSRSICDEVGERLQQDLSLEASPLPPYLDRLIDELRKRDEMIA